VLGRHEWWYYVELDLESGVGQCECKGHRFNGHCSHLDAVREFVRKEEPCPVCRGTGELAPNGAVVYLDVKTGERSMQPLPRACCGGVGTRSAWIAGGRIGTIRTSGLTESEREAIFR
jgi:hypothetical protein